MRGPTITTCTATFLFQVTLTPSGSYLGLTWLCAQISSMHTYSSMHIPPLCTHTSSSMHTPPLTQTSPLHTHLIYAHTSPLHAPPLCTHLTYAHTTPYAHTSLCTHTSLIPLCTSHNPFAYFSVPYTLMQFNP